MDILEMQRRLRQRVGNNPEIRTEMIEDDKDGIAWVATVRGEGRWLTSCIRLDPEDEEWFPRPIPSSSLTPTADIHEQIKTWIHGNYPATKAWEPVGQTVLFGKVQAGKTANILAMIWLGIHDLKKRCVLLLANMTGSYNQVLGRDAMAFNDHLLEEFGEAARPFMLRVHGGRYKTRSAIDPLAFFVVMGNPAQLRRLLEETLDETEEVLLFSDEADVHIKGTTEERDDTQTGPLYRRLEQRSLGVMNVTATPFSLWNRVEARQKTLQIPDPPEYRGTKEMDWCLVSSQDALGVRNGNVGIAKRLLEDMIQVQKPRVVAAGRGYMTILLNGPSSIGRQDALARAIASTTTHRVFSMNSGGSSLIKEARRNHMVPTGRHCIATLYDEFELEALRNPHHFQVYVIVACQTASRAISFRPTSKQIGTGGLNGMIFLPSATSHMAQKIQFMRPFGKYTPDYPTIRIATTEETVRSLRDEIEINLPVLATATREMGISRTQIEGSPVLRVGHHDRKAVDDTCLVNSCSVMSRDFPSQEALLTFLGNKFQIRIMTEGHRDIPMPDMVYTTDGAMRKKIRENVQAGLPEAFRKEKLQFCWNDSRYQTHHSIKKGNGHEYRSRCIAGHGGFDAPHDRIRIVFWKAEYCCEDATSLEDADTAYLFETTRGGWRYYNSKEQRKIGILSH